MTVSDRIAFKWKICLDIVNLLFCLLVFGGDSLIPYITMLNFQSGDVRFMDSDILV